jgi:predicted MPP superfamily phosphohydrolase
MKLPRRCFLRILFVLLLLFLAAFADAFWLEPDWIEVTRHHVSAPVSPPLKIAHLTDLHTYGLHRRERKLLALLAAESPDLIVITGDSIAGDGTYELVREVLSQLRAPLGVWLTRGNWENWRSLPREEERHFYAAAGVNLLVNEGVLIRGNVWLAGLDDPASGSPSLDLVLAGAPGDAYTIALFHAPSYFKKIPGRVPLALAGHTHGGQIRIPLLDPLWLPMASEHYIAGWYEENGSRLYVSRGIGMSIIQARFFCRPELAILAVGN